MEKIKRVNATMSDAKRILFIFLFFISPKLWGQWFDDDPMFLQLDAALKAAIMLEEISPAKVTETAINLAKAFEVENGILADAYIMVLNPFLKQKRLTYLVWVYTKTKETAKATKYILLLVKEQT